jgi:phospholipid/cholesterol/gamma-HCH transport system substrate-binding protein
MSSDANYNRTEIVAGIFVFIGILYLIYVAIGLTNCSLTGAGDYVLYAEFVSASGLHVGDPVEVAGVQIGTVEAISLADYQARVALRIKDNVRIHKDAVASIEQNWLIGIAQFRYTLARRKKHLVPAARSKKPGRHQPCNT